MMRSFLLLALLIAAASAFAPPSPRFARVMSTTQRRMFDAGDETTEAKPLERVADGESAAVQESDAQAPSMTTKNLASGKVSTVNFIDTEMAANTNPLSMNWWAYPLVVVPFVLLLNDAFHFLPSEGPMGWLSQF